MKIIRTRGRRAAEAERVIAALTRRGGAALDAVLPAVKTIVGDVRLRGDRALLRYAAQFDGLTELTLLRVTKEEMAAAWEGLSFELRDALTTAAEQIRGFAVNQLPASWAEESLDGLMTGQLVRPLESVGCYVPSGRHPLPSTLLMTAIPAQVAGVSAHRRRLAQARAGDACRRASAGHQRVLSPGRRTRDCRIGLWDRDNCTRRQNRWSGQSLRHRREATRCLRLRHRHACRAN